MVANMGRKAVFDLLSCSKVGISFPWNRKRLKRGNCITQTRPCNMQQYFTAVKMFF